MNLENTNLKSTFSPRRRVIEHVLAEEIIKEINKSNLPEKYKDIIIDININSVLDYEHQYTRHHRQKRESEYKTQKDIA